MWEAQSHLIWHLTSLRALTQMGIQTFGPRHARKRAGDVKNGDVDCRNPGLLGKDGNARFPDPVEGLGAVGACPRKG
jgi:hypothetical protein